jgi:LysR family glycine cleavage system transcriptional activator
VTYRLPPLSALRAYESACRHLSFKKAAQELHVTPAAISQQIKLLEDYLGTRLFDRRPRALELTLAGLAMLPKVREAFDCLAAAVETTRHGGAATLIVNAPPSFATRWLVPRLPSFTDSHSGIEVRLTSTRNAVDRPGEAVSYSDEPVDPRSAISEVAIRYGTGNYAGFRVEKIFTPEYVPVCSPGLPTAQRPLASPKDLQRHVLIHDDTIDARENPVGWAAWLAAAGAPQVDAQRGPRFSNAVLAVEAALMGQGVALALRPLVDADVAAGRLIVPFDLAVASPFGYFLVIPEALVDRPSVGKFRKWLLETAPQANSTHPGQPDVAGKAVVAVH